MPLTRVHIALCEEPALDAPLESDTPFVSDHFMPVLARSGWWLRLPGDVSGWTFGMVDGVVHIALCENR